MNKKELGFECEKAMRFLAEHMVDDGWTKPVLFHSVRVGTHLFEKGYERDVVIAGFLHDTLEDGPDVTEQLLTEEFGPEVTRLVMANTKDEKIRDKAQKKKELIIRCISEGKKAAIVKAADILDNFYYYESIGNTKEVEGHCKKHAHLLIDNLPEDWQDYIFDDLTIKIYGD